MRFIFSFVPRSQAVYGWQKYIVVRRSLPFKQLCSSASQSENSLPLSHVMERKVSEKDSPYCRSRRFSARTTDEALPLGNFMIISSLVARSESTSRRDFEPFVPRTESISQ